MAMTFSSLQAQIINYLDNTSTSLANIIPQFITNAQQRICRDCPQAGFEQYALSQMIANNPVISKPSRWRYTTHFDIRVANPNNTPDGFTQNILSEEPFEYCLLYTPDPTITGTPKFYSDQGYYNWYVSPTPDLNYPFRIGYIELPEPLTINHQTNWLTDYVPDILLYSCLLESAMFLKTDERLVAWSNEYQTRIQSLNQQNQARYQDRASKRNVN